MNKEMLLRLRNFILKNPRKMDMSLYFTAPNDREDIDYDSPECGTTGCIAGWVTYWDNPDEVLDFSEYEEAAAKILGIDIEAAKNLFYSHSWPLEFKRQTLKKYEKLVDFRSLERTLQSMVFTSNVNNLFSAMFGILFISNRTIYSQIIAERIDYLLDVEDKESK